MLKSPAFILSILLLLWLTSAQSVFAANSSFSFSYKDQGFNVDPDTVSSWQGGEILVPNNIFKAPPESLPNLLLGLTGQQPKLSGLPLNYHYSLSPIYDYIKTLAQKINRPTQEPALIVSGNRASQFAPPQNGLSVDVYQSALDALAALELEKKSSDLVVY